MLVGFGASPMDSPAKLVVNHPLQNFPFLSSQGLSGYAWQIAGTPVHHFTPHAPCSHRRYEAYQPLPDSDFTPHLTPILLILFCCTIRLTPSLHQPHLTSSTHPPTFTPTPTPTPTSTLRLTSHSLPTPSHHNSSHKAPVFISGPL